jgi:bacterioferritin-associated ferredoxin
MYVCICNAVTEQQIRATAEAGTTDLWELQMALGVAAGCGTCLDAASGILAEYRSPHATTLSQESRPAPVLYRPATA